MMTVPRMEVIELMLAHIPVLNVWPWRSECMSWGPNLTVTVTPKAVILPSLSLQNKRYAQCKHMGLKPALNMTGFQSKQNSWCFGFSGVQFSELQCNVIISLEPNSTKFYVETAYSNIANEITAKLTRANLLNYGNEGCYIRLGLNHF